MGKALASIGSALGKFFGPSPGTAAGTVNATDIFRSALIPAAIFAVVHVIPFLSVGGWPLLAIFALDLLRRLPHDTVPGESTFPTPDPLALLGALKDLLVSSPTSPVATSQVTGTASPILKIAPTSEDATQATTGPVGSG